MLASLTDFGAELKPERMSKLACKDCGMTYEEFGRTGRLGCANCYQVFEKLLIPLIKRVQRDVRHVGKVPSKASTEVKKTLELRELQDRLRKSIQSETFEEAAKIRDQIQQLEEKLKKGSKKQK
ncbi:MAG: UvrB/UvrC motif-containing protein [Candidatus Omnitrophica bacterium]|nr:UvrB/UvrC motif-containing protein [Candidatus Omnitrophota bacterium]